ncbi:MAG: DsbA family protein [Rhodocyclales bacterium GT-UBC]|nr:MAG: DsbA family protein [Rhodocyclales bacterium GT-UBC]
MTTLHYIYDPLCGWCYGAAPLLKAARQVLAVQAHGGGMMTGANRQPVTPQLRAYVQQHDARIAQLTGQPFGPAYNDGLLHDTDAILDSEPPTAAVLAAEAIAGRGLDMLAAVQTAHYVDGRRIAERATLIAIAGEIGLDAAAFAGEYDSQLGEAVHRHIQTTRHLMAQVGARGFPSFVLETDGVLHSIDLAAYLGNPQAFQDWLRGRAEASAGHGKAAAPACDINGCAL